MLVDEPYEPEIPQLKRRKLLGPTKAKAPILKGQDKFSNILGAWRKEGLKPKVQYVAKIMAFLANEPIAVEPLNMDPLALVGAA
jgi:hypothetical protein